MTQLKVEKAKFKLIDRIWKKIVLTDRYNSMTEDQLKKLNEKIYQKRKQHIDNLENGRFKKGLTNRNNRMRIW